MQLLKFGRNIVSKIYSKIPQGYWIGGFLTRSICIMPIQNVLYKAIEPEFQRRSK